MNIEDIRDYCLSFKGVSECFPFDETTLVFKVMDKMFCMTGLDGELSLNLKNDPEKNIQMREEFPSVTPGYHMNKKYWNTVNVDGSASPDLIRQWIRKSYETVILGLTKKQQEELKKL